MLNFCDFIQVFIFTTNHHLKVLILCTVSDDSLLLYQVSMILK